MPKSVKIIPESLITPTVTAISSTADTNLAVIKATPGTIYGGVIYNSGAGAAYLKLYNKATAPVLASDVPVMVIPIAATGAAQLDLGTLGYRFSTGIAYSINGAAADTGTTAVLAAQVKVALSLI